MIVDHRTYAIKPGKLNEYLKAYETEALPLQLKYLGHCVGWYVSNDIGPLNQVVHMWAYQSLADREARRGKLAADPGLAEISGESHAVRRQHGEQDPAPGAVVQAAGTQRAGMSECRTGQIRG